jgi:hypothetical protein
MDVNQIKELYRAAPFEPFEIVLVNGTAIPVVHPEFISFSPDGRTLHVWDPAGGGKRVDAKHIITLNENVKVSKKNKKK